MVELVNRTENAERAGVKQGDILLNYNDLPLKTYPDLVEAVSKYSSDSNPVSLKILRSDQEIIIAVETGSLGVAVKEFVPKVSTNPMETTIDEVSKNTVSSPVPLTGTGYISLVNLIAVLTLVIGIVFAGLIFAFFGFVEVRYGITEMNPIGIATSIGILIQSIITFILLKVVAIMALEIKAIKVKLQA